MLNRKDFMKFIPKPDNKDVILYDNELQDLLDVEVLEEYNKECQLFFQEKEEYISLSETFKEYEKFVNSIYLYQRKWNEEDYLGILQNDKKTYSKLYSEIKKTETNISILQKKAKVMQEKIDMQTKIEERNLQEKKDNIDITIENIKDNLDKYRGKLSDYVNDRRLIDKRIENNEEEFNNLQKMNTQLNNGVYKCELCGHTIKSVGTDSKIYARLCKKLEVNKEELEHLIKKKNDIEANIAFFENEIKKEKSNLQNAISFKKEARNFYRKKSLEILKLEALRDEIINNITLLEKSLKTNPKTKESNFIELKDRISKCEISLENLRKIKVFRMSKEKELKKINELKESLKEHIKRMDEMKKFLIIYFKIYEQRANDYCLNVIKFKIFEFEDYKLKEIFKIYYNNILYEELEQKDKDFVDKILIDKFQLFL